MGSISPSPSYPSSVNAVAAAPQSASSSIIIDGDEAHIDSDSNAYTPSSAVSYEQYANHKQRPFQFLALPPEIRELIYSSLLTAANNRYTDEDDDVHYGLTTALFAVSKQVRAESRAVFLLQNVFVALETPWVQAEKHVREQGRVPMICTPRLAQSFTDAHMVVQIDTREPSYTDNCTFVILAQDLKLFCRLWYYSDLSHPHLNNALVLRLRSTPLLSRRERFPRELQRTLLAPFGCIKGLADLTVTGFDAEVVADVRAEQDEPYESPESCLQRCEALREAGHLAVKAKKYDDALTRYFAAFHAIHIVIDGRRRSIWGDAFFETDLIEGQHKGLNGSIVRISLRIKLVSDVVHAYLQAANFAESKYWGFRSIELMRETLGAAADEPRGHFPAAREWGLIYYWTGLACKQLNEMQEARNLFLIALNWLPGNTDVVEQVTATALPPRFGRFVRTDEGEYLDIEDEQRTSPTVSNGEAFDFYSS